MDRLLKVILGLLFVTSTIAQLLEDLHGPHGARNPARLTLADDKGDLWKPEPNHVLDTFIPSDGYYAGYKEKPVVFEYIKPINALLKYLQHNKTLPVHYGVIDWDEVRKFVHSLPHSGKKGKGKFVESQPIAGNSKTKNKKILKKLEKALRNHCDPFLLRSKEKNTTENIYNLNDPVNVWNMYLDYGLKGPVKVRKYVLGTTNYVLEDPLVLLKGILNRHSKIPTLDNGFIDWNQVFKLTDDDMRYFKSELIPPNKRPVLI